MGQTANMAQTPVYSLAARCPDALVEDVAEQSETRNTSMVIHGNCKTAAGGLEQSYSFQAVALVIVTVCSLVRLLMLTLYTFHHRNCMPFPAHWVDRL